MFQFTYFCNVSFLFYSHENPSTKIGWKICDEGPTGKFDNLADSLNLTRALCVCVCLLNGLTSCFSLPVQAFAITCNHSNSPLPPWSVFFNVNRRCFKRPLEPHYRLEQLKHQAAHSHDSTVNDLSLFMVYKMAYTVQYVLLCLHVRRNRRSKDKKDKAHKLK